MPVIYLLGYLINCVTKIYLSDELYHNAWFSLARQQVSIAGLSMANTPHISNRIRSPLVCSRVTMYHAFSRYLSRMTYCNHYTSTDIKHHPRNMMTSSNGNIFRVTGPLRGEFTGDRWISRTTASDAELWCFLWSVTWINGWVNNHEAADLSRHCSHYDVLKCIHYDNTLIQIFAFWRIDYPQHKPW